jgi:hypothetical protein
MSSILIQDLGCNNELDRHALRAVRGGFAQPNVNVNINLDQKIGQFQDIKVNVLNNNGVIGAGFQGPSISLSPNQWAMNQATLPQF